MKINQKLEYDNESNGTGIVDTNTEEFKNFHMLVAENLNKQTKEQKIRNLIFSIKFNMEDYLKDNNPVYIIHAGDFLKKIMELLDIQSRDMAQYLKLRPSNFNAIINGNRKFTPELALKLGYTFGISPDLWTNIETKNNLIEIEKKKSEEFKKKYKLDRLIPLM